MRPRRALVACTAALAALAAATGAPTPVAAATPATVQVWVGPSPITAPSPTVGTPTVSSGPGPLAVSYIDTLYPCGKACYNVRWVYRTRVGSGWSTPTTIVDRQYPFVALPALATDVSGAVHVAYTKNGGVVYQEHGAAGAGPELQLAPAREISIALDPSGTSTVAALTGNGDISFWRVAAGATAPPPPATLEGSSESAFPATNSHLRVSGDGAGGVLAVWVHPTGQRQGETELHWARFTNGAWSAPAAVPGTTGTVETSLASGGDRAVLAYGRFDDVSLNAMTFRNGSWGAGQLVEADVLTGVVAVGSTGDAAIISPQGVHTKPAAATSWAVTGPPLPRDPYGPTCAGTASPLFDGPVLAVICADYGEGVESSVLSVDEFRLGMPPTSRLVPVVPARVLDTRAGQQSGYSGTKPVSGQTVTVQVGGRGGVPATGVSAVVLNVVATSNEGNGYVSVWPADRPQPVVSSLNMLFPGQTVANQVVVPVSASGAVSLFTSVGTELVADVDGYYVPAASASAGRFVALEPARVLETRAGSQSGYAGAKPVAGQTLGLQVTGRGGVPVAGASAVVLNVTATETDSGGYLTVWPSGSAQPFASSLNYERTGQTVPNHVLVPVGADGRVLLFTSAGTHLIADVAGYFTDATAPDATPGLFVPVNPIRLADSRGRFGFSRGVGSHDLLLAGVGPIPSNDTGAVVANFTVTGPEGPGYVTVWPSGSAQPTASNLNVEFAGQTRPNLVSVAAPNGSVSVFTNTTTDLIADLAGYYTSQ